MPFWFHTFALNRAEGIYTPGAARDHRYRVSALPEDFAGMSVLDVGCFDGFCAFLAERRRAERVVAVDNEQYRLWVASRWGVEREGGADFRAVHRLLGSGVEYRRMDAFALDQLEERFDFVYCFGILHRVEIGLTPQIRVPEPNTWREILSSLDAHAAVCDRCVAVLEYGVASEQLIAELEARGAEVFRAPLYRWALPEDMRPLQGAVSRLARGGVDFVLFTSRRQVEHVMRTARELGLADAVLDRARRVVVVASIGPASGDTLRRYSLPVDLESEHPKMRTLGCCGRATRT